MKKIYINEHRIDATNLHFAPYLPTVRLFFHTFKYCYPLLKTSFDIFENKKNNYKYLLKI